jgi:hypothetical protein
MKAPFIQELIQKLRMHNVTLMGASWGGSFSVPFLVSYGKDLVSSVQVCPIVPNYPRSLFQKTLVSTGTFFNYLRCDSASFRHPPSLSTVTATTN